MTGKVVAATTRAHEAPAINGPDAGNRSAAATLAEVKRQPQRAWPKGIVEVASQRPDPRADPRYDPHATQKISRAELDAALRRTKSGTRPVTRSAPDLASDAFHGPRDDDAPQITIVRIDSMEMSVFDPSTLPAPSATPVDTAPVAAPPRHSRTMLARRLQLTPRLAFIVGLALVGFVMIAGMIGFFAGRITGH